MLTLGAGILLAQGWGSWGTWGPPPPVAPYTHKPLPKAYVRLPMIFPVIGSPRWGNSYGRWQPTNLHTGIDIAAPKLSPIVAPFSGVLGMKRESFWIYGDNGYTILGTHLNDDTYGKNDNRGSRDMMFAPNLYPNSYVRAGQFLGYVGDSGHATGPHLHFELYSPGIAPSMERLINPYYSLKVSQHLKKPRAFVQNPHLTPDDGQIRFVGCLRKPEPKQSRITLVLVAKQDPVGRLYPRIGPEYLKVRMTRDALEQVGGWPALNSADYRQEISVYGNKRGKEFLATEIRIEPMPNYG